MKIAIIRPKVGLGWGGAENYVANCSLELLNQGHKVTLIADRCGLPGVYFKRAPLLGRGSMMKNLSFFILVKRILKKEKFDLVYTCCRTAPSDLVRLSDPLHAAWLDLGYEFGSSSLRKKRPRHKLLLWLEKESLKGARKGIITNSKMVKQEVIRYYSLPQERIYVLYNGCDFNRFNLKMRAMRDEIRQRLGLSDKKILLFVGHDWRRKGLDIIKKILPRLPEKCVLLVAGGKKKRFQKRIRYLGRVKNMPLLYSAADLLVLPTRYDPFANVVLEALACGLPVVTSKDNGATELIRIGETGFAVSNRPEEIEGAILKLLENPPSPEICHQSVAHLSWKRHVSELLSLAK